MIILSFTVGKVAQTLTVDVTNTEKHSAKVTLSKHPVEEGVKITDHARSEAETIEVDGFISDTPVGSLEREGKTFPRDASHRGFDAALMLYEAKETKALFVVMTPWRAYKNMILTSLEIPESGNGGIKFTGTFEQVRFATTQTVANPLNKKLGGFKPTTPAPTSPPKPEPTWLFSLGDATATTAVNVADWFEGKMR